MGLLKIFLYRQFSYQCQALTWLSLNIWQIAPSRMFLKFTSAQVFIYKKGKIFHHWINIKATMEDKIKTLSDFMPWVLIVQCTTYIDLFQFKKKYIKTCSEYLRTVVLQVWSLDQQHQLYLGFFTNVNSYAALHTF